MRKKKKKKKKKKNEEEEEEEKEKKKEKKKNYPQDGVGRLIPALVSLVNDQVDRPHTVNLGTVHLSDNTIDTGKLMY